MLGKLIKHEWKATARNFCAMYLLVFIITVVLKVMLEIQNHFKVDNYIITAITVITVIAFVLGIIGIMLGTYILILKRFYDSLLKKEGYLSFTLPVTTGQHIAGKSIVSYLWVMISGAFILLMIFILLLGFNGMIAEMKTGIELLIKVIAERHLWKYAILFLVAWAISMYAQIAWGYASFSIGQTFGKNKVLGAFVTYIAIYFILQIVSLIAEVFIFGVSANGLSDNSMAVGATGNALLIFVLVQAIVESVIFVAITHYMLNKKLNLE